MERARWCAAANRRRDRRRLARPRCKPALDRPSGGSVKQFAGAVSEVSGVELRLDDGHFSFTGSDERLSRNWLRD